MSLHPESVEALQAVDLQLCFGTHGIVTAVEGHGTAIFSVTDGDYLRTAQFVDRLDSARGDTLALEGMGYTDPWRQDAFFDGMRWEVGGSRYLNRDDEAALDPARPAAVFDRLAALEKLRNFQITGPVEYAVGLAALNGINCHYADASSQELNDWWDPKEKIVERYVPEFLYPLAGLIVETRVDSFRDVCTVRRLGEIASQMKPSSAERPILGYLGGAAHRKHIEELLTEAGVPYKAETFTPDRSSRNRNITMHAWGHLLLRVVDSVDEYQRKSWLANASRAYTGQYGPGSGGS